jgi:CDP-diacylglycerol pyrophosphatase
VSPITAGSGVSASRAGEGRLRRLALAVAVGYFGFLAVGALAAIAAERGHALWGVVEACVANARLTGFAFPCLRVDLSRGEDRGFVVLRPPVGRPDTILSPTRRTVGIEDPWLETREAPNLFLDAWNMRRLAPNGELAATRPEAMGLAVNSRYARQQDQLHIHIGCVRAGVQGALRRIASVVPSGAWTRAAAAALPGQSVWVYRTGESDPAKLQPFQIAAEKFTSEPGAGLGGITLAMIPVAIGAGADFLLIAFPTYKPHHQFDVAAEDLLEASCASVGE